MADKPEGVRCLAKGMGYSLRNWKLFFVVVVAVPLSVLIGSAFVNNKKSDRNKWHKNINKQDYKYKLASWYNFCWVSSFAKGFSNVISNLDEKEIFMKIQLILGV